MGGDPDLDTAIPMAVGIAAGDADGDGDIDLFLPVISNMPQVFENDGAGNFTEVLQPEVSTSPQVSSLLGFMLVDFDGDGLLDLLFFGPRTVEVARNLGGLEFGVLRTVFSDDAEEVGAAISATLGDADGDGDLDLFLPGLDPVAFGPPAEVGTRPSADRLLIRVKDRFRLGALLQSESGPGLSMVGLFTDRDGDGDQDLLVPSLRGAFGMSPTAFYRNTGEDDIGVRFQDDASSLHANLAISGMGIDSADLNGDGVLDYCISDLNRMQCLLSDGTGAYAESAEALGMVLAPLPPGKGWSGWSVDLVDLDNDGMLDAVAAAGPPLNDVGDSLDYSVSANQLWQGESGAFHLVDSAPFSGSGPHYGLVTADLNGDGALEVLFSGPDGGLQAFYNQCTASAWTDIRLAGPVGNEQGIGARVFLRAGGQRQVRQIQGLRGFAQGPARAHFGVGEADLLNKLTVVWPDGTITISRDLPVNRSIRVPHPSRFVGAGETGDTASGMDSGTLGPMATLSGTVSRSASLILDGIGDLYVLLFEDNPVENPGSPPVAWGSFEADFSQGGATQAYRINDIPLGSKAYNVVAFLDDNGSGHTTGPDSGDLMAMIGMMEFPQVEVLEATDYELNLDLNFGLQ
jgi:hypothetical protein